MSGWQQARGKDLWIFKPCGQSCGRGIRLLVPGGKVLCFQ